MKKNFTLKYIQLAWVTEIIIVLIYSMFIVPYMGLEKARLWMEHLPHITALIGAQGAAASIGPLVADKIKNGGKNE